MAKAANSLINQLNKLDYDELYLPSQNKLTTKIHELLTEIEQANQFYLQHQSKAAVADATGTP